MIKVESTKLTRMKHIVNMFNCGAVRLLMTALLLFVTSVAANAYDFTAKNDDGVTIYYNITSSNNKTAAVTYGGTSYDSALYSGVVVVPQFVTYNGDTYTVTSIGIGAFYKCSGLTEVTIPNSVITIGEEAFERCSGLTEVTIGNSVTTIGFGAFYKCSGLTEVTIPNSVTYLSGFLECTGLTKVTIPNSVTEIGSSAFAGCTGLTGELTIPNSVTSIGGYAFSGCSGLTEVTIGNSVTSIGSYAFSGCSGLTGELTIPNSVTSICEGAFSECWDFESITSLNPEPPKCGFWVFSSVDKNTCVLHVPKGTVEAYSTAYIWQDFLNIVEIDASPVSDVLTGGNAETEGYYTIDGIQVPTQHHGINFIRYNDGTVKKVLTK